MTEPEPNALAHAELLVEAADLASAVSRDPSDIFPAVFATARLVALLEIAAGRVLSPLLAAGELSVGVAVDIVHTSPTPEGTTVTATARYIGSEGKQYIFEVIARDPGGEIGRGTHRRAIISTERLIAGARRRNQI